MTTPHERTRAILRTRELLEDLQSPQNWPDLPDELRRQARVLARHYPEFGDLRHLHMQLPMFYGSPDSDDAW